MLTPIILMVWKTLNNTSSFHCSSEFDHQDPLNVLAAKEFETNSSNVMASSGAGSLYPLYPVVNSSSPVFKTLTNTNVAISKTSPNPIPREH